MLTIWKTGVASWQNRYIDICFCLFRSLDFYSYEGGVNKKNLPIIHSSWAWSQKAMTGWPALRLGDSLQHHIPLAFILSDLKRPWVLENLKFKTAWLLKAPLNAHCGSERYIITSMVLRWCTEPIYQKRAIPLMMYDYNSPLERCRWCVA